MRICPLTARKKKKKKMVTRGKIIEIKASHHMDLARPRVLRGVILVLVLLLGV